MFLGASFIDGARLFFCSNDVASSSLGEKSGDRPPRHQPMGRNPGNCDGLDDGLDLERLQAQLKR